MQISLTPAASQLAPGATTADVLFTLQAEPGSAPPRRPLNLSLVIDRSGSMGGTPLKHAIRAGQQLVGKLKPTDLVSVVIFDDDIEEIVAPQAASDAEALKAAIGKIRAGGCTNLHGGWKKGVEAVQKVKTKGQVNRVLLLTDGQANVGETRVEKLIEGADDARAKGIQTTTLGFGSYFQEDLLIGMAKSSGGNFYFIQSTDEAAEVFDIELQSLEALIARGLAVELLPVAGVTQIEAINPVAATRTDGALRVPLGDVYGSEPKRLGLRLSLSALGEGTHTVATLRWSYEVQEGGESVQKTGELPLTLTITAAPAARSDEEQAALVELARIEMARVKDDAVALADKGDLPGAAQKIRAVIEAIRGHGLQESFEIAEELDSLDHYAKTLESRKFDASIRKELRDQAHQGANRSRTDLKLRGIAAGSSSGLATIQEADVTGGVLLKCVRESGKLRMKVVSDGYDDHMNVQFPRAIREEGVTYRVESLAPSADNTFYRAVGDIQRVLRPGESVSRGGGGGRSGGSSGKKAAASAPATAADLEPTSVVDGVLVQCVKEGSKLRARVVSDGYNPDWNIRFPRSIRELGVLYVVEEVEEAGGGGSYIAYGKIKRLVQAP